ncbi:MAG: hypothetical protein EAZ40_09625 [Rhodobacterales bacterium]|nr:MAG: hypothetical protein EAZ40_09625 [Rhodobacterales bacterium]
MTLRQLQTALLAMLVAGGSQVAAQTPGGPAFCAAVWADLSAALGSLGPVSGTLATTDAPDEGCAIDDVKVDLAGTYTPDILADRLVLRGPALAWVQDGATSPDRLEARIDGLRFVVQTGHAQMDYLMAAQAGAGRIGVDLALAWAADSRSLAVERLEIDFPGENRVALTARATGVDLSTSGAAQMSVTSFAVTEVDLTVQSHGLFESYVLMALGPTLLPLEGDMQAAERDLKAAAGAAIAALPATSFPPASKAALHAVLAELPNPSGTLTLAMRSDAGIGPARLMGYAMTGVPDSIAGLAPLLDGVTFDIGWSHASTP